MTAGCICKFAQVATEYCSHKVAQLVAHMWRHEKPEVNARLKALADQEDQMHKMMYPSYCYEAGRRNHQLALSKLNLPHNPITVAERLIAAGF
jgi:hypothetical protein